MRNPEKDAEQLLHAASAANVEIGLRALDVREEESVRQAFEGLDDLEVLVNNAGIISAGSSEETTVQWWKDLFETNLFGSVRCMKAALPLMRARGGGCVVNISSLAGAIAQAGTSAYGSSKAALEYASEVLAIEGHQHGIRVVIVETGATMTAIGAKLEVPSRESPYWPAMRNTFSFLASRADRLSQPDDIAEAIARAVRDPECPLRIVVGSGARELLGLRATLTDDEWSAMANRPPREFVAAVEAAEPVPAY